MIVIEFINGYALETSPKATALIASRVSRLHITAVRGTVDPVSRRTQQVDPVACSDMLWSPARTVSVGHPELLCHPKFVLADQQFRRRQEHVTRYVEVLRCRLVAKYPSGEIVR